MSDNANTRARKTRQLSDWPTGRNSSYSTACGTKMSVAQSKQHSPWHAHRFHVFTLRVKVALRRCLALLTLSSTKLPFALKFSVHRAAMTSDRQTEKTHTRKTTPKHQQQHSSRVIETVRQNRRKFAFDLQQHF